MPRSRGGRGRGGGGSGRSGRGRGRGKGGGRGQGQSSSPPMCKFFLKGTCNRGSECRFRHDEQQSLQSDNRSSSYVENEKDGMYYASIDEAHDGLWLATGFDGMMIALDDDNFLEDQEMDFLDDVEIGDSQLSHRQDEFVHLNMANIKEVILSLRDDRDLMIAAGVTRRLVEGLCPPVIRITRLDDTEMAELTSHKQKGNQRFVAKRYQDAIDQYEEATICIAKHLFIAPINQIVEVVNVLSNQAECHLRLQEYSEAAQKSTDALLFDPHHEKARIRRAKAELAIYKAEHSISHLAQACYDLETVLEDDASDIAAETALALLDEANGFLEREKEKMKEEEPESNFDFMIRFLKSKCW